MSDILDFSSIEKFDVIHDRASFHFLTKEEDIQKYATLLSDILGENGLYFVGTFSESGPLKCSGLEIKQYNETSMSARFEVSFNRIKCITEDHVTPFNTVQNFVFCSFQKK